MKTIDEIEQLKISWCSDPSWDIESTEGFEDYHDELLKWRIEYEEKLNMVSRNKIESRAKTLGCTPELLELIDFLIRRIERLESEVCEK